MTVEQVLLTAEPSLHPLYSILFKFYFMCMSVLPACMYVHHVHAWCPKRSEEDPGSPETGVTGSCKELGIKPRSSARAASALNH